MMALTDEPPDDFLDDFVPSGSASSSPQPPPISPSALQAKRASLETPPMELDPLSLKVDPENSKLLQAVQKKATTPPNASINQQGHRFGVFSPRNLINQIR